MENQVKTLKKYIIDNKLDEVHKYQKELNIYKERLNQANLIINDLKKENEKIKCVPTNNFGKSFSFKGNDEHLSNNKKNLENKEEYSKKKTNNSRNQKFQKNSKLKKEYTFDIDPNNI